VGLSGAASAKALAAKGFDVVVYNRDDNADVDALRPVADAVYTGEAIDASMLDGVDAVVVSPGIPPHHALPRAAASRGIEVFSEPELAWRLRGADAAPWLAVTGTNGKTTTVTMLASILSAAGLRSRALGNIGQPLVEAVDGDYDVLAVELSSQQLHWSSRLTPRAGALLNLADDHLSWHGDFDAYSQAKTAIWRGDTNVGNLDDALVTTLLESAPGTHIGFTLGIPAVGQFGIADGSLLDHSGDTPVELCPVDEVNPPGLHNVANALAASALARSFGVPASAVRQGLRDYQPEPHRNVHIATVAGVRYVDDSKGTNPHATAAAIAGYDRIVWIAGGQLKGVDVNQLVEAAAPRLRGVVALGADRARIIEAAHSHAPGVPVVDIAGTDPEVMSEVVSAAARMAEPGDVVLLSPAGASYDMFTGYPDRGRRFAAAVATLDSTVSPRAAR
jgi:UDP-N-acetylmuramoylalanine--D-glutamate ligase